MSLHRLLQRTHTFTAITVLLCFFWMRGASAAAGAATASSAAVAAAAPTAAPTAVPFYTDTFESSPTASALTSLGRALFFDRSLSASGRLACASCHDPAHGFGPPGNVAVQLGGSTGRSPGVRAVQSLMYTQNVPPFSEHFVDDDGDDSIDQGPAGGRTWDGRAQSAHDQAKFPLFSPFEMANSDAAAVVAKVEHSAHAAEFRATFGAQVFADEALAFKGVLLALETYQQSPEEFYPYTSKYDAWLRRQAALSAEEARGLEAFNDPQKGNCARCHTSAVKNGAFPQFTDFGFIAIGVPRNLKIAANHDRRYFDLGLCGPLRTDLAGRGEYCGMFRTPSLRNVALRGVYFHNGLVRKLEDAVRFYSERDTHPERWYPLGADGTAIKFNDLPDRYWQNIDTQPPFDRHVGEAPALSADDIKDIVAFLRTLTDGYSPSVTALTPPAIR